MTEKRKRSKPAGPPSEAGNVRSPKSQETARSWTDEEMASAEPRRCQRLILSRRVACLAFRTQGQARPKPAGRPEIDEDAAR